MVLAGMHMIMRTAQKVMHLKPLHGEYKEGVFPACTLYVINYLLEPPKHGGDLAT